LADLLQCEYKSLHYKTKQNRASAALLEGLNKADKQSNLVVISAWNHDAEALGFNIFNP